MPVKDFSRQEITWWVMDEPEAYNLGVGEISHVVDCLEDIVKWYFGALRGFDLDPFLIAVLRNDLMDSWAEADDTNRKALGFYVKFLYNNLPLDYKERAKGLK